MIVVDRRPTRYRVIVVDRRPVEVTGLSSGCSLPADESVPAVEGLFDLAATATDDEFAIVVTNFETAWRAGVPASMNTRVDIRPAVTPAPAAPRPARGTAGGHSSNRRRGRSPSTARCGA